MPICLKRQVAKTSPQVFYEYLTRGVQQNTSFVFRTKPNSRNIFTDAGDNIQTHVLTSIYGFLVSQFARQLYSLPTPEGGFNIKEPITYDGPPDDEDQAISHLNQDITQDQRFARHNEIWLRKKDLTKNFHTEQLHVAEMASEQEALNWPTLPPLKRYGFRTTKLLFRDGLYFR